MVTVARIQDWILFALWVGVIALQAWALVDCITRKAPAFPAAGKLTKPTWILLTAASIVVMVFIQDVTNLLAWIVITVSAVYLADVRPAVREISGPSRW